MIKMLCFVIISCLFHFCFTALSITTSSIDPSSSLSSFISPSSSSSISSSSSSSLPFISNSLSSASFYSDPNPLIQKGDVYIGVLAELRGSGDEGEESISEEPKDTGGHEANPCRGTIAPWALEEVAALEWAIGTINNQSKKDFTIGVKVFDTCFDSDVAVRQATHLLGEEKRETTLLGVVALGSPQMVAASAPLLHAYNVPLLVTHAPPTPHPYQGYATHTDNIFTTAPHLHAQVQAVLSSLAHLSPPPTVESRIALISSCQQALKTLLSQARKMGFNSLSTKELQKGKKNLAEEVISFMEMEVGYGSTLILLLETSELNSLVREAKPGVVKESKTKWVFSVLDGEPTEGEINVKKLSQHFPSSIVVTPQAPLLPGLSTFLQHSITSNGSLVAPLFALLNKGKKKGEGSTDMEPPIHLLSGSRGTACVKAASSLAAAFRLFQIELCGGRDRAVHCLEAIKGDVAKAMLDNLMKLSYQTHGSSDNLRYTADGRLVTNFKISKAVDANLKMIGVFKEDTGVVWGALEGLDTHADHHRIEEIEEIREGRKEVLIKTKKRNDEERTDVNRTISKIGCVKELNDLTGMLFLLTGVFGAVACLAIIVVVCIRYHQGFISGIQVDLGMVLLIALLATFASVGIFVVPSSPALCVAKLFFPSTSLVLCYGIVLVKMMNLRALANVGSGGKVSHENLIITLIFVVGVSVCINLCWHFGPADEVHSDQCEHYQPQVSALQKVYMTFILLLTLLLGVRNKNVKNNYNERTYLMYSAMASLPIIAVWGCLELVAPPCLRSPTICAGSVTVGFVLMLILLTPKMKQLIQQNNDFKHKRLSTASSLSTIFTQLETIPPHPLQPPPPFCDPPAYPRVFQKAKPLSDCSTISSWRASPSPMPITPSAAGTVYLGINKGFK